MLHFICAFSSSTKTIIEFYSFVVLMWWIPMIDFWMPNKPLLSYNKSNLVVYLFTYLFIAIFTLLIYLSLLYLQSYGRLPVLNEILIPVFKKFLDALLFLLKPKFWRLDLMESHCTKTQSNSRLGLTIFFFLWSFIWSCVCLDMF